MVIKHWLLKIWMYYKYEGFFYTFKHAVRKVTHAIFGNLIYYGEKYVLFYADLKSAGVRKTVLPEGVSIERYRCRKDISYQDWETFCSHFRESYLQSTMKERFDKGASLWIVKVGGLLAGYIWSTKGATVNPYFGLLRPDEVNFFDNMIFEKFRGRGINPLLVNFVLYENKKHNCVRAFIETLTTNTAEIRSLAKTNFRRYGLAKSHLFWNNGHLDVGWKMMAATINFKEEPVEMQVYDNFDQL